MEPISDAEVETVADAADGLRDRVVNTLVATTGPDPDEYEFPHLASDYPLNDHSVVTIHARRTTALLRSILLTHSGRKPFLWCCHYTKADTAWG